MTVLRRLIVRVESWRLEEFDREKSRALITGVLAASSVVNAPARIRGAAVAECVSQLGEDVGHGLVESGDGVAGCVSSATARAVVSRRHRSWRRQSANLHATSR